MRLTSKSGFGVMLLGINLWFGLGSRFWVTDFGFPIWGVRFSVPGLGFMISGFGFWVPTWRALISCFRFWVQILGF